MSVIKQITDVIESVGRVKLLDIDPGKDTNRTVVTLSEILKQLQRRLSCR